VLIETENVLLSLAQLSEIIGNEKEWKPFYKPWKDRLAQDGLEYYKDSHCTLNGQFHKFRSLPSNEGRALADKVRDDLDAIIRRMPLVP
jgi:hypothetical protein